MKKYNTLLVVLAISVISLLFGISVNAAPINGLEQTLIQPDGTEITVYLYGDEIYSYMTDREGNVVVENPETGYYVYASIVENEVTATNYALGIEGSGSTGGGAVQLLTAENIPQSEFTSEYENSRFYKDPNAPEIMSPLKVAKFSPFGKNRVYEMIRTKELKAYKYQNTYIIAKIDLVEYLADHCEDGNLRYFSIKDGDK